MAETAQYLDNMVLIIIICLAESIISIMHALLKCLSEAYPVIQIIIKHVNSFYYSIVCIYPAGHARSHVLISHVHKIILPIYLYSTYISIYNIYKPVPDYATQWKIVPVQNSLAVISVVWHNTESANPFSTHRSRPNGYSARHSKVLLAPLYEYNTAIVHLVCLLYFRFGLET